MRQKSNSTPASSETLVRDIRRATRKHHAAEEKIRIVLDGPARRDINRRALPARRHRREHVFVWMWGSRSFRNSSKINNLELTNGGLAWRGSALGIRWGTHLSRPLARACQRGRRFI